MMEVAMRCMHLLDLDFCAVNQCIFTLNCCNSKQDELGLLLIGIVQCKI